MRYQDSIKALRIELGISQSELAQKLGVNVTTVSRWENGLRYPKTKIADNIVKLAMNADISNGAKENVISSLNVGRRRGTSASEYGFPDIDQELLIKIVNDSSNAVYAIDVDTHELLYVNKSTEKLAKTDLEDISGKKCYEYMHNGKTPCEQCPINNVNDKEYTNQIIKKEDGTHMGVRGRKMKWNGRNLYVSYVSDITELMNARKSVQHFLNMLPIGAGIYRIYKDARIEQVYMNDMFYRVLGLNRETSKIKEGLSELEQVHPDDREILLSAIRETVQNQSEYTNVKYRINLGNDKYQQILLRGVVSEVKEKYVTFNCTFVKTD